MRAALVQFASLGRRSIIRTLRQPQAAAPAFLFPLIFLAMINAGAGAATRVPGFPADRYLDFVIAGVFVQGALSAGVNTGTDLAVDIESGFLNRLSLTPLWRPALLLGEIAGSVAVGLAQGLTFLVVALIFGVEFQAGVVGMLVLILLFLVVTLAFSAIGAVLALRTGSSEVVQASFPLFFVMITFSSFFLPRDLIPVDWFRLIATYNPISYMIEAMRSLVITGWEGDTLALGAGLGVATVVLPLGAATWLMRSRAAAV